MATCEQFTAVSKSVIPIVIHIMLFRQLSTAQETCGEDMYPQCFLPQSLSCRTSLGINACDVQLGMIGTFLCTPGNGLNLTHSTLIWSELRIGYPDEVSILTESNDPISSSGIQVDYTFTDDVILKCTANIPDCVDIDYSCSVNITTTRPDSTTSTISSKSGVTILPKSSETAVTLSTKSSEPRVTVPSSLRPETGVSIMTTKTSKSGMTMPSQSQFESGVSVTTKSVSFGVTIPTNSSNSTLSNEEGSGFPLLFLIVPVSISMVFVLLVSIVTICICYNSSCVKSKQTKEHTFDINSNVENIEIVSMSVPDELPVTSAREARTSVDGIPVYENSHPTFAHA